jgi:hypothetical protein
MVGVVALSVLVGCRETTYVETRPPARVVVRESRPPGWDRGVKAGWEAGLPPGQLKKLRSGRLRIREVCRVRGLADADVNRIMVSFDLAVHRGCVITVAESAFAVSVRTGMTVVEVEHVGRSLETDIIEVDEASLEVYIKGQIGAGIRGEALGLAVGKKLKPAKAPKPKTPGKGKGKGKPK